MSFVVLGHFSAEGPDDLLFVTTDRVQADQVVAALERHHEFSKYHSWRYPGRCGCFSVAEVPDLVAGQASITYEKHEIRLDYWRPPVPASP